MDFETLSKKWDPKNVRGFFHGFPRLLKEAFEVAEKSAIPKTLPENVVVCGMGGSAISGFILKDLLKEETRIPIEIENSYSLPAWANEKTLVLIATYSGFTEETLACLEEARKRNCLVQAVSGNPGIRKTVSNSLLVPTVFPQTRFAFPVLFASLLFLLERACLNEPKKERLLNAARFLDKNNSAIENQAQQLALELHGKLPFVVASHSLRSVALKWVQDFNENSKSHAVFSYVSEMNHNQINAFLAPSDSIFLFLREKNGNPLFEKRLGVSQQIFGQRFETRSIPILGESLLERALFAAHLGAFASYFLALLNAVDPEPIPGNELLKKEMKRFGSRRNEKRKNLP